MNRWEMQLMQGRTINQMCCVFCGKPKSDQHHVVYRSRGGGCGPTLSVCGNGNASGCHMLLHIGKLHPFYVKKTGKWIFAYTPEERSEDFVDANFDKLLWHDCIEGNYGFVD